MNARRSPTFSTVSVRLLVALLCTLAAGCGSEEGRGILGGNGAVDAIFAEYSGPDSPGCALGVIEEGEFVYRRGYGLANLEHRIPNTPDSVFRVGSVSKQFVGMLVLLLEEEGLVSREDDIRRWVPEIPDFGFTITVDHLLHHTSGLRDYLVLMSLAGYRDEDYYTASELLAVLSRQRELNFAPGHEHLYSNTGYFLLGQIIERATDQTLDEAAQQRIFGPLGMIDSHFHDDATRVVPRRASGYAPAPDGDGWIISMTTLPIVGDGAVFTTVNDLLAWDRNFYDNRLGAGDPELIERWLESGVLADGTDTGYGAGIAVSEYRGLREVSHGGSFVGFRAQMMRFPERRFGVVVLCNVSTAEPTRLARRVADVYLGDAMGPPQPASDQPAERDGATEGEFLLPLADLRGFAGRFTSPELQVTYVLGVEDGRLVWQIPGRFRSVLLPDQEDRFRGEDFPSAVFRFARNSNGEVSGFLLDAGRVQNLWFERVD